MALRSLHNSFSSEWGKHSVQKYYTQARGYGGILPRKILKMPGIQHQILRVTLVAYHHFYEQKIGIMIKKYCKYYCMIVEKLCVGGGGWYPT